MYMVYRIVFVPNNNIIPKHNFSFFFFQPEAKVGLQRLFSILTYYYPISIFHIRVQICYDYIIIIFLYYVVKCGTCVFMYNVYSGNWKIEDKQSKNAMITDHTYNIRNFTHRFQPDGFLRYKETYSV